jgi:hypothetical protein
MDTLYNNYHVQKLLQSYGQWVHDHMAYGWHGYLLSFMFCHLSSSDVSKMMGELPGSDVSKRLEIMKRHLGWFYGRLAKASVPEASSPKWCPFLPKVVLSPDLPVPKRIKVQLRDVTINNGLHWHGLVMVNPLAPKLPGNLDVHIKENWRKYLMGSIRKIGVEPITHDPEYVTGYGMKGLKRSTFSYDDILIFPRTVSELPTKGPDPRKGPVLAAVEKPMYDFQRT